MEAQQVTEKILADARAEAEKINKLARQKQAEENAQFDRRLAEYREETDTLAQKAAEDEKLHLLATDRMDLAKQHLAMVLTRLASTCHGKARQDITTRKSIFSIRLRNQHSP